MNELERYFIAAKKERSVAEREQERKQSYASEFSHLYCTKLIEKFSFLSKYNIYMNIKFGECGLNSIICGCKQFYIEVTKGTEFLGRIEIPSAKERKRCNAKFFCANGKLREMGHKLNISARNEEGLAQVLSQFI